MCCKSLVWLDLVVVAITKVANKTTQTASFRRLKTVPGMWWRLEMRHATHVSAGRITGPIKLLETFDSKQKAKQFQLGKFANRHISHRISSVFSFQ